MQLQEDTYLYTLTIIWMTANFSLKMIDNRRHWNNIFKMLTEKHSQASVCPQKQKWNKDTVDEENEENLLPAALLYKKYWRKFYMLKGNDTRWNLESSEIKKTTEIINSLINLKSCFKKYVWLLKANI